MGLELVARRASVRKLEDVPEGAVLIRNERRGRVQGLLQEPTQRLDQGRGGGHAGSGGAV